MNSTNTLEHAVSSPLLLSSGGRSLSNSLSALPTKTQASRNRRAELISLVGDHPIFKAYHKACSDTSGYEKLTNKREAGDAAKGELAATDKMPAPLLLRRVWVFLDFDDTIFWRPGYEDALKDAASVPGELGEALFKSLQEIEKAPLDKIPELFEYFSIEGSPIFIVTKQNDRAEILRLLEAYKLSSYVTGIMSQYERHKLNKKTGKYAINKKTGAYLTESVSKGEVVRTFIDNFCSPPDAIVFCDDIATHVDSVLDAMRDSGIFVVAKTIKR